MRGRRDGASAGVRGRMREVRRYLPAMLASLSFHGALLGLLVAVAPASGTDSGPDPRVPLRLVARPDTPLATLPAPPQAGRPPVEPESRGQTPPRVAAAAPSEPPRRRRAPEPAAPGRPEPLVTEAAAPREGAGEAVAMAVVPGTGLAGTGDVAPDAAGGSGTGSASSGGSGIARGGPGSGSSRETGGRPVASLGEQRQRYGLEVRQRLAQVRRYPDSARRAGRSGEVLLRVHVDSDGRVLAASIESPSEWPDLDRAAIGAADRLSSLPPPPGGPIAIEVPVHFNLRDP